ncbi:MAG: hypothetical protein WBQ18_19315 [Solirubrobacteraceae bacterium]
MGNDTLGSAFARALGHKDFDALLGLLDTRIDFRGLTPGRAWEASGARAVIDDVLRQWFEDSDTLVEITSVQTDSFADRQRVAYRFRGENQEGPFIVEQQAYYTECDGRINWMRVLCSGFRPA